MMPIEIWILALLMFGLGGTVAFAYQAYKDLTEMRKWWWDYQQRMTELDQRISDRDSLEKMLSQPGEQRSESGEVAKQPRAEGDMFTHVDRDNVFFLKAENEEQ